MARPSNRRLSIESLEDRRLMAADIVWTNRETATNFTDKEVAVVDQAIRIWEDRIVDFDSDPFNLPQVFNVSITGGSLSNIDLGGTTLGRTTLPGTDPMGSQRPEIVIAAKQFGMPIDWYIDPHPSTNSEFTHALTPSAADQGPGGFDMLSVVVHELGHGLGIFGGYTGFSSHTLGNPATADFVSYFSNDGSLIAHLQARDSEGVIDMSHLDSRFHPNDAMTPKLGGGGIRKLPSELDVRLLANAFGYRVDLPQGEGPFAGGSENFALSLSKLSNGVLTITGDPNIANDNITLDRDSTNVIVSLNGVTQSFARSDVNSLVVNAGSGFDVITLGDSFAGTPVIINGNGNTDALVADHIVNLWRVTGTNAGNLNGNITFSNVELLAGGNDIDTFMLDATASVTRISGRGGSDTLIGPNASNTWLVDFPEAGSLKNTATQVVMARFEGIDNLTGGSDQDNFGFRDYTWLSGRIDGKGGFDTLSFSGCQENISLDLTTGGVTSVGGSPTRLILGSSSGIESVVGSQGSADRLIAPDLFNAWKIQGNNNGFVTSTRVSNFQLQGISYPLFISTSVNFFNVENLIGGSNSDSFEFSAGASIAGRLDGKLGLDTLNYTGYTTTVRVDLTTGQATGVAQGVVGIENVTGGSANDLLRGDKTNNVLSGGGGNDVILGGDGMDTLWGGSGRDLLIGGLQADVLDGGLGEDILIGGTTAYDSNDSALMALMAEWGSTNSNETRVLRLRNGGHHPTVLSTQTVIDDKATDTLMGGSDLDWFWAFGADGRDTSGETNN